MHLQGFSVWVDSRTRTDDIQNHNLLARFLPASLFIGFLLLFKFLFDGSITEFMGDLGEKCLSLAPSDIPPAQKYKKRYNLANILLYILYYVTKLLPLYR